jgi:hypothetical protein
MEIVFELPGGCSDFYPYCAEEPKKANEYINQWV